MEIDKYENGELVYWTSIDGHIWHSDKIVQQLKAERDLLLQQLVVLDGEDVTVQVTQEQFEEYNKLKAENEELKDTIKKMEDDLDDWISDVSILYTYDDGKPNNLDELQCCMEHVHEEWSKYKQCLDGIEEICNKYYKSEDELLKIRNMKWLYAFSKGNINGKNDVAKEILQKIKEVKND